MRISAADRAAGRSGAIFVAVLLPVVLAIGGSPADAQLVSGPKLYSVCRNDPYLRVIDPAGAQTLSTTPITLQDYNVSGGLGLAVDPTTGVFWAVLKGYFFGGTTRSRESGGPPRLLVTVDPATGVATYVADVSDSLASITFTADGVLYGVVGDGGSPPETLYTIDKSTGAATLVTALGNGSDGEAIAYNPDDGLIYHASGNGTPNAVNGEIFETFNPADLTIQGITLSGYDYREVLGLAYETTGSFLLADLDRALCRITTSGVVTFIGTLDHLAKGIAFEFTGVRPTVTSVVPDGGSPGAVLDVQVRGTGFAVGATVSFGAGITVNSATVASPTVINANLSIAPNAALGPRTVTVTNPGGLSGSLMDGFTVRRPPPTVTAVTPGLGSRGAVLDVQVEGTGFVGGATVSFGAGITVNSATVASPTVINANLSIAPNAALGPRTVTVTNPDSQAGALSDAFLVRLPPPEVTSVTPNRATAGARLDVTVFGRGFRPGAGVEFGPGITVGPILSLAADRIVVPLVLARNAALGRRDVTVTNPDGQVGALSGGFRVVRPDADKSSLAASPATAVADAAQAIVITIAARDASNQPLVGIDPADIVLQGDPADGLIIGPASGPTNAVGRTTVPVTSTRAGRVTFRATIRGIVVTRTAEGTFLPGPTDPDQSTVVPDRTTAVADGRDPIVFTITVRDVYGNPRPGVPRDQIRLRELTSERGLRIVQPQSDTDSAGRTTAVVTETVAREATFTAVVEGETLNHSAVVTFVPGPTDADRSTVTADRVSATADGRDTVSLTITLRDAQGNPRPGVPKEQIIVRERTGSRALVIVQPQTDTDAAGRTTATVSETTAREVTFEVEAEGVLLSQTVTLGFGAGLPDGARSAFEGDRDQAVADGADAVTLTITVRDAEGNPVIGLNPARIIISADGGGPTGLAIRPPTEPTDADGRTTATVTSARTGLVTLRASADGVAIEDAVTVVFTPRRVSPERSTVVLIPERIAANGEQRARLEVALRDADGVPVDGSETAVRRLLVDGEPAAGDPVRVVESGETTGIDGRFVMRVVVSRVGDFRLTVEVAGVALPPVMLSGRSFARMPLAPGLAFVGLPLAPDPESLVLGLRGAASAAARWDPASQSYRVFADPAEVPIEELRPGRGFWIQVVRGGLLELHGGPPPAGPFRIDLQRGWNAAANPFSVPLTWRLDQIRVLMGGADVGTLADRALWDRVLPYGWIYDPATSRHVLVMDRSLFGFESSRDELPPLAGLWLFAAVDDVALVLPAPSPVPARARRPADPRNWSVNLVASVGEARDAENCLGVSAGLTRALPLTAPLSPAGEPAISAAVVTSSGRAAAGALLPPDAGEQVWELEVQSRVAGEVTLSWPALLRELPRGVTLTLTDAQTGRDILLNARSAYVYTPSRAGEIRRFRVVARQGVVARSAITGLFAAPTRGGGLGVTLTLTGEAEITLTVRGLGGKLVRTLTEQGAAGALTVAWDGTDDHGRRVPRGTYVLEAVAISPNGAASRAVRTVTIR